ncbi:AAA family ATPase, partial [Nostocales cyanobacterium LEGE 12452]|nr:AAA family ATPase [Nostocales cyanobacterium LEGE 12452]
GQVIAIIYVLITSQFPTVIIIDEPQSFLHPGAAKKLIEIIKAFPQHQYFIASHSPDIITTANPSNIIKLQYQDSETKALVINTRNIKSQDEILGELGVNLSDIFGADYILWVEGPTEEKCFPLILEQVAKKQLNATKILAVKNTGDLEGKRAEIIFDIYDKLSGGNNLFPPTIGFILDRENKSETEIQDLQRRSKKPVKFIKRRMYENYLIHPDAILYVINKHDIYRQHPLNHLEIEQWINNEKENKNYISKDIKGNTLLDDEWFKVVDGANLLKDLFRHFTENRVAFSKTKHSLEITEWLIKNKCDSLHELSSFLVNSFFISQIIDEVKK